MITTKTLLGSIGMLAVAASTVVAQIPTAATPTVIVSTTAEPMADGKFQPAWDSLKQYQVPEWFRDAKFGIWAHWGSQCQPERGDWYAREMYSEGNFKYREHLARYGHPSTNGFKEVIHAWKAENWDPEKLLALYKRAGARYFFALANHPDNFDNYESKYQPWNSVNLGPKKDLIGGWAAAARKNGMKFGVTVHAAHAWSWYETAQGADKKGPLAGVPYDGKLTKADGKGTRWEGFDPQDLYAQNHTPSPDFLNLGRIHARLNWGNGVTPPDQAYCEKFYNRTMDLINKYQPDLIYFDDTALPLWPVSDAGLKLAAHFYNRNNQWHGTNVDGVLFGKILNAEQRQCMAWDIERGSANDIQPLPWQTDTCLGSWHYDKDIFDRHRYKSSKTVVQMLVDIVSKNGNLLHSVPLKGDGTPDADEIAVVEGIAQWMEVNKEAIHGTRPWKVYGEGPQMATAAPLSAQGFNEGRGKPFTAEDVRFTRKGDTLYAFVMGVPTHAVSIKSLGTSAKLLEKPISEITLLGSDEKLKWSQTAGALVIEPLQKQPSDIAIVYKITPAATTEPPFVTPLKWKCTDVLIKPVSDETHNLVSVKDPTVVRFNDKWHVYATTANTGGNWSMVYLSFADWKDAAKAKPYYLDQNPNLRGYHCAPQVFYFRPQKKWYLIYQSQPPQYSTTDDLSQPETWTKPESFFAAKPASSARLWIDFWVICDDTHAYLFSAGDDGRMYRSRTKIEEFPKGMSDPEIVIQGPRNDVFEGSMTYRIKGASTYLTLIEAIGPGPRYYRAWIADRLDGDWTPVSDASTFQKPFAGINNVTFEEGVAPWTKDISHGELIRDGYDETLTIDPDNLEILFQGRDPAINARYDQLPYKLGLLKLDRSKKDQ